MLPRNKKSSGFSIIELSIVLSIIALIATTALTVGASRIEAGRVSSTQERMDFIMEAMELFVKRFGYLPCPADPTANIVSAAYGDGTGSGTIGPANCTATNLISFATATPHTILWGVVPTQQLNISPAIAVDGWGRRFSYIVDENMTWEGTSSDGGFDEENGEIQVMNTLGGVNVTISGAVVLLSHGKDGHGAWVAKGGASQLDKGCTLDPDQDTNTTISTGGCTGMDDVFVQKFRTQTFDDMLEYRLKWQFDVN